MILQVKRPNQQCHSTEVNEVKADPTRLRSLKNEEKAVIKKKLLYLYSTIKTEDTEAVGRQRAKLSKIKARYSQPTCKNCSYHYNSTQYSSTETVLFIFPFLQTNITSQMWPSGGNAHYMPVSTRLKRSRMMTSKQGLF